MRPSARDPDRVLGRERGQRVVRARAGQTLWASSMTSSTGSRSRAALPEVRRARLGDERLLLARRERAEVDDDQRQRRVVDARRAATRRPRAPRRPSASTPRLRTRSASRAPPGRSASPESATAPAARSSASSAANSAYSSRSAIGSRRSSAACAAGSSCPKRSRRRASPSRCAERTAIEPATSRQRSAASGVGVVAHLGQPHEVRVRVEHDDPQLRLEQQLLEHQRRASSSCPSPTGRTGTCGGRSRRRRARTARRRRSDIVADLEPRPAAARRARASRRPRPAWPAAPSRSLNGVPPPSRITPSPRASRSGSRARDVDLARAVAGEPDLAGVDLDRARARAPGRARVAPSPSSTT